jgi:polar amino acid transport system permease protein
MSLEFFVEYTPFIAEGIIVTLQLTLISYFLGFLIGSILLLIGMTPLRIIARIYIEVIRGTPLLVQLFFIYFGLPSIGVRFDAYISALLALTINTAAYQAEILRSAVKSIPEIQILSAESLGMSRPQIFRYIILPLSLRTSIPAMVNEFLTILKQSSLASIIGVVELTRRGEYVAAYTYRAFESYLIVASIYLAASYIFSYLSKILEKKYKIPGYTGV